MSDLLGILVLILAFGALLGAIASLSSLMPAQEDLARDPSTKEERA